MLKNIMTGNYVYNDETHQFTFSTNLSAAEKVGFVNFIVDILVGESGYHSIIRDLITDFCIIDTFTDIDTTAIKNSSTFINDVELFLEETNIVEIVKINMDDGLFEELDKAISQSVEYLTGIHSNSLNEALASLVNTLEKKINGVDLSDMANMAQKFIGITEELTPESVVNAYINSDIHKKNLVEIEEVKSQGE